jgi:hypothetical protein
MQHQMMAHSAQRLGLDNRDITIRFPEGETMSFVSRASKPALGPTQPPISPGVKRMGREADHWSPASAEVKNAWSYTSTPPSVFMAGA